MLATLALVSSLTLAPGQTGSLQLTHPRPVLGPLGAARQDSRILPGDVFCLSFDVENLTRDDEGKVAYTLGVELFNPTGNSVYKPEPLARTTYNVLGGNRIRAFAHAETNAAMKVGEYTLKVTIVDKAARPPRIASLTQKFTLVEQGFGMVKLITSYDKDGGLPAPFGGVIGQSLFVNFALVGFARKKGQPHVTFEMHVLDGEGKPTLTKPMTSTIAEGVAADWHTIPMNAVVPLNRAGKYTVELKAKDLNTLKTAQLSFPITVVELK